MAGALRRALAAGGLALWSLAAAAQTAPPPRGADQAPPAVARLLGAWTLEQVGASRQCTVTFGADPAPQGRQIRFPATCRRALPILDSVIAWSPTPDGGIALSDAGGKPVIQFGPTSGQRRQGRGSDGKDYGLDATGFARAATRPPVGPAEAAATAAQRPTQVDPRRAP
uniref:AprI/Inh family metalloprotease inhibitor n=1 Tax=Bosea sp. (in: a-proteobacteria) TaxID=1871050 RepID=UPI0025C2B887